MPYSRAVFFTLHRLPAIALGGRHVRFSPGRGPSWLPFRSVSHSVNAGPEPAGFEIRNRLRISFWDGDSVPFFRGTDNPSIGRERILFIIM